MMDDSTLMDVADGRVAPRDGPRTTRDTEGAAPQTAAELQAALLQLELGPNNERLAEARPDLVHALRELEAQYREEGMVARRHEIRRIRQARLFWQGLQYAWWNPQDMTWHLPYESKVSDDSATAEMPRYQFVTNIYQAFGLSFISVLSQDVPATRFYPQSAQSIADIATAKAASEVSKLVEQNNRVQHLLTGVAYYLWTDGKIGGYVRYIADAQRFGSHDEPVIEEHFVPLGEDMYVCPECGREQEVGGIGGESVHGENLGGETSKRDSSFGGTASQRLSRNDTKSVDRTEAKSVNRNDSAERFSSDDSRSANQNDVRSAKRDDGVANGSSLLPPVMCRECGAALGPEHFLPAQHVAVPLITGARRVANGQEVISVVGGLELNTPVWANEMHEYPYLQWSMEVHRAKLKASYPAAADKIENGGALSTGDDLARASRVAIAQGLPAAHSGDALFNLVTFSRTWIRPWAFYALEDAATRDALLALFPDGCYIAFAGDTYCESRNESMDDRWRVMHALPGNGQNRPSVGDSLVQIQERYNTLSNIQAETYEYGIPPIYADPQVLDFDALSNQTAEPAAHYPARSRPGQPLAAGFFQPAAAQVPPDLARHQQELMGPVAQFLTGLFPAVFGGEMDSQQTASGYAMARDQALGRLGLVWRRLKTFYSEVMLLSVDCFRKNRPEDAEIPFLGPGGEFESRWIRLADLKGNIQAYPEGDETFPRLKSQQRAVIQQMMASSDPLIQQALSDPSNVGFVKAALGLGDLVVPGEDSRNKQLREIDVLLSGAPIAMVHAHQRAADAVHPRALADVGASDVAGGITGDNMAGTTASGGTAARSLSDANTHAGARTSIGHGAGNHAAGSQSGAGTPPGAPTSMGHGAANHAAGVTLLSSVAIDLLFDDHVVELAECRRWANSDAGQVARMENPAGFANVHAHAEAHMRAVGMAFGAKTANE